MKVSGITNKLKDNAFLISALATGYSRAQEYNPDNPIGELVNLFTKTDGALYQLQETLKSPSNIKYKLWDAPHAPTAVFKMATYLRIATELGFLTKYKKMSEEIMKGAGLMAVLLPGSGPIADKYTPQTSGIRTAYQY